MYWVVELLVKNYKTHWEFIFMDRKTSSIQSSKKTRHAWDFLYTHQFTHCPKVQVL